jgi:hypothetical protein
MATLIGTTVTTYNASTSASSTYTLCSNVNALQQWTGTVSITSIYYTSDNYVNVLANTNGYSWVTGFMQFQSSQSYNATQSWWFMLSRYGLTTTSGPTNDGLITPTYYQNPSNPNINYMRLNNVYNQSWGNATCFISAMIFPGGNVTSISSDYLTRVN